MPTPKQVLDDDNFWNLPLPDRMKVMKTVDPDNFGNLRGFEQLRVIGERQQKPSERDRGFLPTIIGDVVSLPGNLFQMAKDPAGTVKNIGSSMGEQLGKARESF